MEFKVLGPLDVVSGGRSLPLGGVKQRAVLALLLLHANRVVATSRLLEALWPEDARPVTARKMVQNAVWGLRTLLESGDGQGHEVPRLLTRAPGYVLRVDPEQLDATRFERAVAAGRARLDAGEAAEAAGLLREALAEWRGSALSDLAEQGVEWAELTALRQLRLDAMEDRFEAELACGRHHAVLGELASLAGAEPLRERLCGQLMLALYRCGRQAEALSVFSRVRLALVEEYGLEPSTALQTLQHRILRHDQALACPTGVRAEPGTPRTSVPGRLATGDTDAVRAPDTGAPGVAGPDVTAPELQRAPALLAAGAAEDGGRPGRASAYGAVESGEQPGPATGFGVAEGGGGPVAERRDVCVLVLCTGSAGDAAAIGSERLDISLDDAVTVLTATVEDRSGTVVGSMGGLCAALFGLRSERPEASLNAVRAAFAARDRLAERAGMVMRAVVISGKAIVRYDPHDPGAAVSVVGTLLDTAHGLLSGVPEGELYVSEDVACDTGAWVSYGETTRAPDGTPGIRRARALHPDEPTGHGADPGAPPELALLENLLDYSRHHDVPSMLTVLGEHRAGASRLLARIEHRVTGDADGVRVVRPRVPRGGRDAAGVAAALLEAWAPRHGARHDPPEQRIRAVVRSAVDSDVEAARLLRVLCPAPRPGPAGRGVDLLTAWGEVIAHEARHRAVVLCLDDLHLAHDVVLDWAESLSGAGTGALLVVACGHSDLLRRRPFWGSACEHTGRLTLPRLREPAAAPQPRRATLPSPDRRPRRQEERVRPSGRIHHGFRGEAAEPVEPVEVRPGRRAV
ncbi:BTAD domain-containing putative transcriptional regulator [Streptomyces sp. NEAU-H22]|uniref:BTAD domain-containing putative transcriptional regulator n=1 Tax=Streptomyces sp. NEAU-H22 TaxID=2994655 RepID=UPI00224EEA89|nr:BTAD domain-containing putative transcriptional regulator [Streptomyces sp. NEAU-H22]MCX3291660.1 BTAD domain-containing putative transcriptional regulator [Streptomyces sp. NEAU-H22]